MDRSNLQSVVNKLKLRIAPDENIDRTTYAVNGPDVLLLLEAAELLLHGSEEIGASDTVSLTIGGITFPVSTASLLTAAVKLQPNERRLLLAELRGEGRYHGLLPDDTPRQERMSRSHRLIRSSFRQRWDNEEDEGE